MNRQKSGSSSITLAVLLVIAASVAAGYVAGTMRLKEVVHNCETKQRFAWGSSYYACRPIPMGLAPYIPEFQEESTQR